MKAYAEERAVDVLIIGGGITGLTTATRLAKAGRKVHIYTEDEGGLISSHTLDDFNFDYGGHVYTPTDGYVKYLLKEAGAATHKRKAIYMGIGDYNKKIEVPYPVQDHASLLSLNIIPEPHDNPANFEQFLIAKFGKAFYYNWAMKFNRRVWTIDPALMDIDWVKSRVKTTKPEDKEWGANASFLYAPGYKIRDLLVSRAISAGVKISKGTFLRVLPAEKKAYITGLSVFTKIVSYKWLINTIPPESMNETVKGIPTFLRNRVRTVGIGFSHKLDLDFHWAYANVQSIAHRITLLSRYHVSNAPKDKDSFIIEFPYRNEASLPSYLKADGLGKDHISSVSVPLNKGYDAVREAGFSFEYDQLETTVISDTLGYPIPTIGVRDEVEAMKRKLFPLNILTAGRWGSHGYFNLDHCVKDAQATADVLLAEELNEDYLRARFYYG